jgi:hypothetical protein
MVSRDRSGAYAQAATEGASQAEQVADRWHLLKNVREAVERVLERYATVVDAALKTTETPTQPAQPAAASETPTEPARDVAVPDTNGTSLGVNPFCERVCVCGGRVFRGRYPSMIIL